MKVLHTFEISDISLGKLVLSGNSDKNVWLCFSTSKDEGIVKVYDTLYPTSVKTQIKAHKSPISSLLDSNKFFSNLFLLFLSFDKFIVIDLKTGNLSLIKLLLYNSKNYWMNDYYILPIRITENSNKKN